MPSTPRYSEAEKKKKKRSPERTEQHAKRVKEGWEQAPAPKARVKSRLEWSIWEHMFGPRNPSYQRMAENETAKAERVARERRERGAQHVKSADVRRDFYVRSVKTKTPAELDKEREGFMVRRVRGIQRVEPAAPARKATILQPATAGGHRQSKAVDDYRASRSALQFETSKSALQRMFY